MLSLATTLTFLRTNNMLNSATKEIVGSNIPHVLLVANKNEFVDQAINQFGNTAVVFGGGWVCDKLINGLFGLINKTGFSKTGFAHLASQQWFHLGKSLAIYSLIASYVVGSPFLRNYITLKRTKALNYTEMVGLGDQNKPKDERALKAKAAEYLNKFATAVGIGAAITGGLLLLTQLLAKRQVGFPKLAERIHQIIGLPNGDYKRLKDIPTYLFWALPCYFGLFTGARDQLEKKEVAYRAAGFGLAFLVLPRTLEWVANKFLKGKVFPRFGPGENIAFLIQMLSGIVFYTSIPTVVNLLKRKERAQTYGLIPGRKAPIQHTPQVPIRQPVHIKEEPLELGDVVPKPAKPLLPAMSHMMQYTAPSQMAGAWGMWPVYAMSWYYPQANNGMWWPQTVGYGY